MLLTLDEIKSFDPCDDGLRYGIKTFGEKAEYADVHKKLVADERSGWALWLYGKMPKTDEVHRIMFGDKWDELRACIDGIKRIKWFSNAGEIPDDVKMFDTRAAAWAAAWAAALDAARDAAWAAAWAAALDAAMIIVSDLPNLDEHIACTKKRMDIWRAGYGVLCDVDGVIYAYKKI